MSEKDGTSRRDVLKGAGAVVLGAAATSVLSPGTASAAKAEKRWAMVLDLRKCVGCRTCTVACKSENGVALGRWNTVIKEVNQGSYPNNSKTFITRLCNHCAGDSKKGVPPCVDKCPEAKSGKRMKQGSVRYRTGATYKRPDGMILFDNSLCIGCYKCIKACPYGVRHIDPQAKLDKPNRENDHGIGKCTYCSHRVDNGIEPSCVQACPQYARTFGDMNDPGSAVAKLIKKHNLTANKSKTTLLPGEKTDPHSFYINDDKDTLGNYSFDHKNEEAKLAEFRDNIDG